MGEIGNYQPDEKRKNYLLPTPKPSHNFYHEKVWTLQEQIQKKLKTVMEHIECLYPKLTDEFSGDDKVNIEKNLTKLLEDLDQMQSNLEKNPGEFNTTTEYTSRQHQ